MCRWIPILALGLALGGLLYGDAAAQDAIAPSAPDLTLATDSYGWQAAQRSSSARVPTLAPLPSEVGVMATDEAPRADIRIAQTPNVPTAYDPGYDDEAGGAGCGCGCGSSGCGAAACGKPFKLFDPPCLRCRGITVGGWLQQGVTFNSDNPVDRFNGPVATNDRDGEYLMNQLWLFAERPINTGGYGWDIGGRFDILYGSDFRFGVNHGLEDRINSLDNRYGVVIPQAYVEIGVNNLSIKLGHFAGILDYEAVPSIANPFYSHSYSYGYTVPQLVTGVLATYKLSNQWSVAAGFHRGWMMFEDVNEDLDFMGGVMWNSRSKRTSATFAISTGAQDPVFGVRNRFVSSFVLKHMVTNRLQYVLVQNYGYEDDGVFWQQRAEDAEWYGINQYFLYKINPCWSACMRVEWLRDDDGARIFGVPNMLPEIHTWPGGPGFAGDFYNVTAGLNWRPHPNVLIRPECRYDWYNGTRGVANDLPFDAGNKDEQFTFAVDMILTY